MQKNENERVQRKLEEVIKENGNVSIYQNASEISLVKIFFFQMYREATINQTIFQNFSMVQNSIHGLVFHAQAIHIKYLKIFHREMKTLTSCISDLVSLLGNDKSRSDQEKEIIEFIRSELDQLRSTTKEQHISSEDNLEILVKAEEIIQTLAQIIQEKLKELKIQPKGSKASNCFEIKAEKIFKGLNDILKPLKQETTNSTVEREDSEKSDKNPFDIDFASFPQAKQLLATAERKSQLNEISKLESDVKQKDEHIQSLEQELRSLNDVLDATKTEMMEKARSIEASEVKLQMKTDEFNCLKRTMDEAERIFNFQKTGFVEMDKVYKISIMEHEETIRELMKQLEDASQASDKKNLLLQNSNLLQEIEVIHKTQNEILKDKMEVDELNRRLMSEMERVNKLCISLENENLTLRDDLTKSKCDNKQINDFKV